MFPLRARSIFPLSMEDTQGNNPLMPPPSPTFQGQPGQSPDTNNDTFGHNKFADELFKLISQMPNREENKPSLLRKIGSAIVGIGEGPQAQEEFKDKPFNEKMTDWGTKFGATSQAATLENQNRTRQLQERAQTRLEQSAAERRNVDQWKQELAVYKRDHPNHIFKTGADGYVYAINPQDPSKATKTNVKSNDLTFEDREQLNVDKAENAAANKPGRFQIHQTLNSDGSPGPVIRINLDTNEGEEIKMAGSDSGIAPIKGDTASQAKTRLQSKANQAIQEHPEWKNFITTDPNTGQVSVGTNTDEVTRSQIMDYLGMKSGKDVTLPPDKPAAKVTTPKQEAKIPARTPATGKPQGSVIEEEKVEVINPDGKHVRIPKRQLAAALRQKYTLVK